MNSAMNRELVYVILIGINNLMEDIGQEPTDASQQEKFNITS